MKFYRISKDWTVNVDESFREKAVVSIGGISFKKIET